MGADFKKLQNGSDIRGVALEGIQGEKVNLGKEEAAALRNRYESRSIPKQKCRYSPIMEKLILS